MISINDQFNLYEDLKDLQSRAIIIAKANDMDDFTVDIVLFIESKMAELIREIRDQKEMPREI